MAVDDGAHPIYTMQVGAAVNATIGGASLGTGAATFIGTFGSVTAANGNALYCRGLEVFNLTGQNFDLVFVSDQGTAAYTTTTPGSVSVTSGIQGSFFCPGTAALGLCQTRGFRFPCFVQGGTNIYLRPLGVTAATVSAAAPFVLNFWA